MKFMGSYLVAFGGNLHSHVGKPLETLHAAVAALAENGANIRKISRFYRTPCFPAGAGPDYVNGALEAESSLEPGAFLALLNQIESRFGRERASRWAGRTLDLDVIAHGQTVLPDAGTQGWWRRLPMEDQQRLAPDRLILPHPRLQDRAFVLVPLMDVAPHWRHPLLGGSIAEMCADLPDEDRRSVVPL
ncbi:2-amino-4-hydroxy-6-hydroxymethyldihydropteridine diphosphokinase [Pseudooceanicola nanhaiensis]|uniref:2-amino-4-hydroxy-6- hydroxymethyldihydropteridine diphosphokinase n=1 Tax=Pseudooceanicola nanhaiensis TaxID=375761 RepID=UPI001CD65F77|nr:2-amino-4-hydroxy-6-hydroxymethyldihydropteridine diphosphokinase [Pseudooceanicola nanhaiensis]MCA0918844.1 2-amino-4-hydroxy-6-hydroxymethyldihydropteridine diphosphokinase [Pseudooceanicola nanhaiensis]